MIQNLNLKKHYHSTHPSFQIYNYGRIKTCTVIFLLVFSYLFSLSNFALLQAEDTEIDESSLVSYIERLDGGYIDWENGYYSAQVTVPFQKEYRGRPLGPAMQRVMAERTAKALADSVFLQLAAKIRVDAQDTLEDLAGNKAGIRLMGNIKGRELISIDDDGSELKAVYKVSMRGVDGVISHLYDRIVNKPQSLKKINDHSDRGEYSTGQAVLLIDARGTGTMPALFPVIMDESGQTIYDASMVDKEDAVKHGIAVYVNTNNNSSVLYSPNREFTDMPGILFVRAVKVTEEKKKKRKRRKRKAIKAIDSMGKLSANIIVGKDYAALIAKTNKHTGFLKNAKVVVITDAYIGGTEGNLLDRKHLWALLR